MPEGPTAVRKENERLEEVWRSQKVRTEKTAANIIINIALQITLALSGLLVPRFFIEAYGSSVNGLVSSIGQFITYMSEIVVILIMYSAGLGTNLKSLIKS